MFLRTSDKTEYTITKSGSLWICLHFPDYSSKKSFASGAVMFEAYNKSTKSKQEIYASLSSIEWPFVFNVEWISCKCHYVTSVQIQEFFWSVFSCIWTERADLLFLCPYPVWVWENTDQKNFELGYFSRIWILLVFYFFRALLAWLVLLIPLKTYQHTKVETYLQYHHIQTLTMFWKLN